MNTNRWLNLLARLSLGAYLAYFGWAYLAILVGAPGFLALVPLSLGLAWLLVRMPGFGWMGSNRLSGHVAPIVLVLLTALPRLAWIRLVNTTPVSDFEAYHEWAAGLTRGVIISPEYISLFPHTLGYPLVLSLVYSLIGKSILVAQLLNVLLSAGIVLCVYAIGATLGNRKTGVIAGVFQSLWPSQVFFTTIISTEALFTLLMLVSLQLVLRGLHLTEWKAGFFHLALAGLVIAFANAVRPLGLLALVAAGVTVLFFYGGSPTLRFWQTRLGLLAVMLLAYGAGSEAIRATQQQALHRQVGGSLTGYWLLVGANPANAGGWNEVDAAMLFEGYQGGATSPRELNQAMLALAVERIRSDPVGYLRLLAVKRSKMWDTDSYGYQLNVSTLRRRDPGLVDIKAYRQPLRWLSDGYYLVILFLSLIGAVLGLRREERGPVMVFILVLLGAAVIFLFAEAQTRYHYPMLPGLALLAAYAVFLWEKGNRLPAELPPGSSLQPLAEPTVK